LDSLPSLKMDPEVLDHLKSLRGVIATVCLSGLVDDAYAQAFSDLRSWNDRNSFHNLEYITVSATLVEPGRDSIIEHALDPKGDGSEPPYDFSLQIDADAAPIPPNALARILHSAYVEVPDSDVIGGYCQLKHPPNLPTIDTGTGTWEPIFPGEGIIPVMRTGGHFILVKTGITARFGPPWFKTRRTMRAIDALTEVDNYARIKLDGENPLRKSPAWEKLEQAAVGEGGGIVSTAGEDSGFCDAVKAIGGTIYVDTNLVIGHVAKKIITPEDLRDNLRKRDEVFDRVVGIYA